jgi:hypothetical protein
MDDLGNRTGIQTLRGGGTDEYSVDSLTNRYTAIDASPLAYDPAGNLTQDKDGYLYSYDYENRMIEVTNRSGVNSLYSQSSIVHRKSSMNPPQHQLFNPHSTIYNLQSKSPLHSSYFPFAIYKTSAIIRTIEYLRLINNR